MPIEYDLTAIRNRLEKLLQEQKEKPATIVPDDLTNVINMIERRSQCRHISSQ